jgi:hypothetical protein
VAPTTKTVLEFELVFSDVINRGYRLT